MSGFENPSSSVDDVTTRARQRIGRVLKGKWQLDGLLGVGGMASVYAATHRNGKRGAVKMLHLELSTSADVRARFLREGYVANKVDHPGAVSVLDDDVTETGEVFLVMELLQGESLEGVVKIRPGKRLEVGEIVAVGMALCDVLAAAHDRGIVHRDIKPENVFITRLGELKVLDFGIARLKEGDGSNPSATRTGFAMGTPSFMPPEQALGEWNKVDGRTHLWAVGAALFALATGRVVHHADTLNKLLLAAMTTSAPPLGSVDRGLPAPLCAIVDRALAFDRDHRFPDARAMKQALQSFAPYAGRVALPTMAAPRPGWAPDMALDETQSAQGIDVAGLAPSAPQGPAFNAPAPLAYSAPPLANRSDPLRSASTAAPVSTEATPPKRGSAAPPILASLGLVVVLGGAAGAYLAFGRSAKVAPIAVAPEVATRLQGAAPPLVTAEPTVAPGPSASVAASGDLATAPTVAAAASSAPVAAPTGKPAVGRPGAVKPPPSGKPTKTDAFGNY